jgi:hypothetical protein
MYTEELLSAEREFTYVDLYTMSGNQNTVFWSTPHAAIARESEGVIHSWLRLSYRFSFSADCKEMVAWACSPEHLLEICFNVVLRLLARSVIHSLILQSWSNRVAVITAPTLAYLMEHIPSLKLLSLKGIQMDENHCRVLGAYSRPDLEIILIRCKVTSAGASALVEVIGRNQGPTELTDCEIVLLDGLRGNSRLKSLTPSLDDIRGAGYQERPVIASGSPDDTKRKVLAIAGILKENTGLVVLILATAC